MNDAAVYVNPSDLVPWSRNPRQNEGAVDEVAKSIARYGFAAPIVARAEDRRIIAGHTRTLAAIKLGLTEVPVRFLDIGEDAASALSVADNKLAELADWDDAALSTLLAEWTEQGVDLDALGFSEGELERLLEETDDDDDADDDDDRLDELPEDVPAITQPGETVQLGRHVLHCGDCIEVMRGLDENSVDAVVTDPPYGIGFMGKGWDCSVPGDDFAAEALRVLKPGGHLIAFAATRTVHRLTVAIEDAGFEVRDQIAWVQWQGFPKSLDCSRTLDDYHGAERKVVGQGGSHCPGIARGGVCECGKTYGDERSQSGRTVHAPGTAPSTPDAKRFSGYGTALKPSYEPCVLARKPLTGTVAENLLEWGTGGLNIDGCRYAYGDVAWPGPQENEHLRGSVLTTRRKQSQHTVSLPPTSMPFFDEKGRWPANLYHCPKSSRGEREQGCESLDARAGHEAVDRKAGSDGLNSPRAGAGRTAANVKNHHPTVKPLKLMRWLSRLVAPPGRAVILEPFCGSGTTLLACELEGFDCIAIEQSPDYCDIIRARYEGATHE